MNSNIRYAESRPNRNLLRLTFAVVLLLSGIPAFATGVSGGANFAGTWTANITGVYFNGTGTGTQTSTNAFTVATPDTGSFTGLTGGTITNIVGPPTVGSHPISDFITFNTPSGTIFFDLQTIAAGTGTAAACTSNAIGSICTPAFSPFTLIQVGPDTVAISLGLGGIAYTGNSASGSSAAIVLFTAQDTGTITSILSSGISGAYSATITTTPTTVPEPSSFMLVGTSALGLLGAFRSKLLG